MRWNSVCRGWFAETGRAWFRKDPAARVSRVGITHIAVEETMAEATGFFEPLQLLAELQRSTSTKRFKFGVVP